MAKGILAVAAATLATVLPNVATDPRKLKPGELCRLLNSTPVGEVLTDQRLRTHRARAGSRIGSSTIDLFRYAAWLIDQPTKTSAAAKPNSWDAKRHTERDRQAESSRSGRDIGPPPEVVDPARRAKAEKSFKAFCESYFPERFSLKWSKDHLRVIKRVEQAVLEGGQFAFAMPRGSGKTSLCEVACLWALAIGARKFVLLIGASAVAAEENLDSIKVEIEANELLFEDFPEICYPIQCLEGRANLCAGQHINGDRTHIKYGKRVLALPTVKGSKSSGGILRVVGITGRIRGMKFTRASDGQSVRPDQVIIDDPQTDASAKSTPQCAQREKLIAGAVLGLAGPGSQIAAIMPCTIIRREDMVDRLLDRKLHPAWRGERTKLLYKFPTNMKLWEEYAELRANSLRADGDGSEATTFYRKHRKAMDAGAEIAWPERYRAGEISGLQYALNLYFDDVASFLAEYQNEPQADNLDDAELLTATQIAAKVNGLALGVVPLWATRLTTYIDVQHRLLYWGVAAWADDFTGAMISYGTWPEQTTPHFAYRNVRKTLQSIYAGKSAQAAVRAGLTDLCDLLFNRAWKTEAGTEMQIARGLVDAADGNMTDDIFAFCRAGTHSFNLLPAIGKGIGAAQKPMHEYKAKPGERLGFHWLIQPVPKKATRQVLIDSNFWKSFVHEGLAIAAGDKRCLSLYGTKRTDHRLFAEHLTAETRTRTREEKSGKLLDRRVDVWRLKPAKPDNHWLDCFAGCAAAASIDGASPLPKHRATTKPDKPRGGTNVTYL